MKEAQSASSEPALNDGLVKYSGYLVNTSAYASGNAKKYQINTLIRSNLVVLISIKGLSELTSDYTINVDDTPIDFTFINSVYQVFITVPDGCKCYYRISGSEQPVTEIQEEEKALTSPNEIVLDWTEGHSHDGINSKKVSYDDLLDKPTIPTIPAGLPYTVHIAFNWNGTPAAYGYDTRFGEDGVNLIGINSPETCKLVGILYNTNDGVGNYNVGYFPLTSQVGGDTVLTTDRFALRFYDDSGDKFKVYRNGSAYIDMSALAIPQPQFGNSTYQLIFEYTQSPV